MDIEKAKNIYMQLHPAKQFISGIDTDFFFNFAYVILSGLDKKDKIINEMAVFIARNGIYMGMKCRDDVIDHFTKKVEG